MKVPRYLHLRGTTGALRTAKFEERDHIVVPVVAMVEGVVHAGNSPRPELVLAEELSKAPGGWNGRPVTGGHPMFNGVPISANDPRVLERDAIGLVFNSQVEDKKLKVEAWIDPEKAKRPGSVGERILQRLQNGEGPIEVSVGAFIVSEDKVGTHDGKEFGGVWREIVPDHLAFLSEGDVGACSVEAGCGAPRIHLVAANGQISYVEPAKMNFKDRLKDFFKFRAASPSNRDIEQTLHEQLFASEPAFLGIHTINVLDGFVVYAVMPGDVHQLFQRKFKIGEDGSIKLADKKQEVKQTSNFEPVAATGELTGACGCGGKKNATTEGVNDMDKAQRVKALIENKRSHFTEAHRATLEAFSEEQLKALEDAANAETPAEKEAREKAEVEARQAKEKSDKEAAERAAAAKKQQTVDEYIAAAPAELQETLRDGLRIQAERKTALIKALVETKRCKFSEEALKAMNTKDLENLVELAGINQEQPLATFMGRPFPAEQQNSERISAPTRLIDSYKKQAS